MGMTKFVEQLLDQRFKDLHTSYIGKVVSVNGDTATVQPLGLIKEYGGAAKKQAVVPNVPIMACKVKQKTITFVSGLSISKDFDETTGNLRNVTVNEEETSMNVLVADAIRAGDIVVCVCCDRNISDAIKGENTLPPIGAHSLSDSVIVGVL